MKDKTRLNDQRQAQQQVRKQIRFDKSVGVEQHALNNYKINLHICVKLRPLSLNKVCEFNELDNKNTEVQKICARPSFIIFFWLISRAINWAINCVVILMLSY